jgi:hypothetical protein
MAPVESAEENFVVNFPGTVPSKRGIHIRIRKSGALGHLWTNNQVENDVCLPNNKLDEIGTRLEHTPQKSLRRLAQEIGTSKSRHI